MHCYICHVLNRELATGSEQKKRKEKKINKKQFDETKRNRIWVVHKYTRYSLLCDDTHARSEKKKKHL